MEQKQAWGRAVMGLGILVAVGLVVSLFQNSEPMAVRRERGALLSLFEATVTGSNEPSFTLTNYSSVDKIYIVGFAIKAPGLSGLEPYFEGTAVEDAGNSLRYNASTGAEEAEYLLDFPVPIDTEDKDNEATFVFSFSSSTIRVLKGEDITVSRVLYRKSYKTTAKIYEYDINLKLPAGKSGESIKY